MNRVFIESRINAVTRGMRASDGGEIIPSSLSLCVLLNLMASSSSQPPPLPPQERNALLSTNRDARARTLQYRQELGLLVSEFWANDESRHDSTNHEARKSSPITTTTTTTRMEDQPPPRLPHEFVARHLGQSAQQRPTHHATNKKSQHHHKSTTLSHQSRPHEMPRSVVDPLAASMLGASSHLQQRPGPLSFMWLHPGFVPSTVRLRNPTTTTSSDPSNALYSPTCRTCWTPLQPGALGCTTRLERTGPNDDDDDDDRTRRTQRTATQKRRLRRKNQQQQQQSSYHGPSTPQLAHWYHYVTGTTTTPMVGRPRLQQLRITCGTCQESTTIPLPATTTKRNPHDTNQQGTPSKQHPPTNHDNQVHRKSSRGLHKDPANKNKRSAASPKGDTNGDWSVAQPLDSDFLPLPDSKQSQTEPDTALARKRHKKQPPPRLGEPKHKKKKKGQSELLNFLSSFNNH